MSISIITDHLHKELSLGRLLNPFEDTSALPPLHISQFGMIPKGHNTGKWRLITDLSFPQGHSVNDDISSGLCSLHNITVEDIAHIIADVNPEHYCGNYYFLCVVIHAHYLPVSGAPRNQM